MLLEKFSRIIERSPVGRALEGKARILEVADPERIYVENIRAFLGVPFKLAAAICDLGVKTGQFTKHIGYVCPKCHSIIAEADFESPQDPSSPVFCKSCEFFDDEEGPATVGECETQIFYRLTENA